MKPKVFHTTLVDGPGARGGKFNEVVIRIAEIEAFSSARPFDAALDFYASLAEPLLPGAKVFCRNGEGTARGRRAYQTS